MGLAHIARRAGQPPGGAVGEGKWTVIKQAATETPSVHLVYEAVTCSQALTMKEETPFFFTQTFHAVLCPKYVLPIVLVVNPQ